MQTNNKAEKQNPALKALNVLVGVWNTKGTHPFAPGETFNGRTSFQWINGGAFLSMRQKLDDPRFPEGIAIFGSDNATGEYFLLYFDERDISRKYNVSVEKNTITWWRDSVEFSQRMTFTISDDGKTIVSKGKMSKNGGAWEGDLELNYSRAL